MSSRSSAGTPQDVGSQREQLLREPVPRRTTRSHGLSVSGPATSSSMLAAPRRSVAPGPLAHEQGRLDDRGWRGEPAGGRPQVDAVGDVVGRRGTDPAGVADHAREAEDPLLAAVGVQPHDVPAAGVPDDAPRLQVPLAGLRGSRGAGSRTRRPGAPGWRPRTRRRRARRRSAAARRCRAPRRRPPRRQRSACAPRRWSPRRAGRAPRPGWPGRRPRPRRRPAGCRAGRTRRARCGSRARRRTAGRCCRPRSARRGCAAPPCRARTSSRRRRSRSRGTGSPGSAPWRRSAAGPAA